MSLSTTFSTNTVLFDSLSSREMFKLISGIFFVDQVGLMSRNLLSMRLTLSESFEFS